MRAGAAWRANLCARGRDPSEFPADKYAERMLILGLDTATAMSTVAVASGGGPGGTGQADVLVEQSVLVGNRHAETTPTQVRDVLAQAGVRPDQLDLVAVGVGPGPYTSLRVGIALARALALAINVPVVGYCTLDVIAAMVAVGPHSAQPDGSPDGHDEAAHGLPGGNHDLPADEQAGAFGVATDARRRELYWARYRADGERLGGPLVGSPTAVLDRDGAPRTWAGDGFDRFGELALARHLRLLPHRYPSAATLVDQVRLLLPAGSRACAVKRAAATAVKRAAATGPAGAAASQRDCVDQPAGDSVAANQPSPAELDDQSGDGAGTRVPVNRLLPPLPLYLRRPDAQPPKGLLPARVASRTPALQASESSSTARQASALPASHPTEASPINLRPMHLDDIPAVIKIEREVFPSEPWSSQTFHAELAGVPDRRHYLVVEWDGRVVGYGGLSWAGGPDLPGAVGPNRGSPNRSSSFGASPFGDSPSQFSVVGDVSDIQTVAVVPSLRNRGTGRALVAGLLAHSDALGYASCMLEVRADNAVAIALYESFGFEHLAVRRRYYRDGTDALIMRRTR